MRMMNERSLVDKIVSLELEVIARGDRIQELERAIREHKADKTVLDIINPSLTHDQTDIDLWSLTDNKEEV